MTTHTKSAEEGASSDFENLPPSLQALALIDIGVVCALTGYKSPESIRSLLQNKGFPQPVIKTAKSRRWRLRDVRLWIEAQGQ